MELCHCGQQSIGQQEGVGPSLLGEAWPHPVSVPSLGGETSERSPWHFRLWCTGVGWCRDHQLFGWPGARRRRRQRQEKEGKRKERRGRAGGAGAHQAGWHGGLAHPHFPGSLPLPLASPPLWLVGGQGPRRPWAPLLAQSVPACSPAGVGTVTVAKCANLCHCPQARGSHGDWLI